jgi:hypothetical protein
MSQSALAAQRDLAEFERDLFDIQLRRDGFSNISDDVRRYNAHIRDYVEKTLPSLTFGGDGSNKTEAYRFIRNLQQNIDLRNQRIISEAATSQSASSLVGQRETAQSLRQAGVQAFTTPESGIVSYYFDGLEDTLTIDNIHTLTEEQTRMDTFYNNVTQNIGQDDDVLFRLIRSNYWYVASYIDPQHGANLSVGSAITLYILSNRRYESVRFTVDYIQQTFGEYYVVFKTNAHMLDFANTRNVQFMLDTGVRSGLKLPITAITHEPIYYIPANCVEDGQVRRLRGDGTGTYDTINVRIVAMPDEQNPNTVGVIVADNMFTQGDVLLDTDRLNFTVSEAVMLPGVYIANNCFALFVRIHLEDDTPENMGYIVLAPELNRRIREQDRIVTNAAGIRDGQRLC